MGGLLDFGSSARQASESNNSAAQQYGNAESLYSQGIPYLSQEGGQYSQLGGLGTNNLTQYYAGYNPLLSADAAVAGLNPSAFGGSTTAANQILGGSPYSLNANQQQQLNATLGTNAASQQQAQANLEQQLANSGVSNPSLLASGLAGIGAQYGGNAANLQTQAGSAAQQLKQQQLGQLTNAYQQLGQTAGTQIGQAGSGYGSTASGYGQLGGQYAGIGNAYLGQAQNLQQQVANQQGGLMNLAGTLTGIYGGGSPQTL